MKTPSTPTKGILSALITVIYIAAISLFLFNADNFFGASKSNELLIPIVMLSLLVLSAAITGITVFGRPVIWYLNDSKKEALRLLAWTLGALFVITAILFSVLIIV
jgi:hypothetical protein